MFSDRLPALARAGFRNAALLPYGQIVRWINQRFIKCADVTSKTIRSRGIPVPIFLTLLTGSLLIGMAQVAQTPPFEGFDENAHYSYIQQIAETGSGPAFGDPMSAEVEAVGQFIPLTEALGSRWSYNTFFDSPDGRVAAAREQLRQVRDPLRPWTAGRLANWQAQHPPLYYAVMAPAYLATKGWSLLDQLFLLRGLSYLIAWIGLVLAVMACRRMTSSDSLAGLALVLAPALWPVLFPTWFPGMARLGNDSLLVLIAAIAWMLLIRLDARRDAVRNYALLGGVCGLGLLTKVTFLPFVAVTTVYLVYRLWSTSRDGIQARRPVQSLALFLFAVCIVSGWWYVGRAVETGSPLTTEIGMQLEKAGGLLAGLQKNGSLGDFARGILVVTPMTFLWSGTWSFVTPALSLFLPMFLLVLILALGLWLRREDLRRPHNLLPLIIFALFCAALIQQALVLMALVGPSVIPGWYLHGLMPVFAIVVGLGLAGAMSVRPLRWFVPVLMLYAPVFLLFGMFGQVLFYAGCPVKRPGLLADGVISFTPCGFTFTTLYDRLAVLSYPAAAFALVVVGWILLIIGTWGAANALRRLGQVAHVNQAAVPV